MQRIRHLFCAFAMSFAATLAGAQGYPAKPVKILVPFPPGGSSDLVVRTYTPKLAELLGQQVVVDYKGGAGGSIGATDVAKSAPDGYTLLQVWDTHAVNHHVYKVPYDYAKSFEPVALLVQAPGILVAHPGFGPSTLKELIDYARANPGKVTYGSAGAGSSNHLSGLVFEELAGVQMTHVPYKGGGPLITDLLGGHVDIVFGTLPLYEQHVKSGKMKAIAVLAKARIPQLPNVAIAGDALPGFEAKTWFGLLAPAGTPRDVIARLQREVGRALNDPKVRDELAGRGFDVVASSPEVFATFLAEQSETAGRLVRAAGIKPE
jgi:tripartite-type tricarboxylate transporter receptor subunit TctC